MMGKITQNPKILKKSMKLNWNFMRDEGYNPKDLMGGVWIFSGTSNLGKLSTQSPTLKRYSFYYSNSIHIV